MATITRTEQTRPTPTAEIQRTPTIARRLFGALSAAAVVCAVATPIASAKTVTVKKSFTLQPNTTTTYKLARNPNLSLEDAGYVLTGPRLSVHEDNLVDPYPHQPKNVGQISRDGVSVIDAGIGRVTAAPPLEIRVKTGKLSDTLTITLYVVQQGSASASKASTSSSGATTSASKPITKNYVVSVKPLALAKGTAVNVKGTVTSPEARVSSWWSQKTVATVVRKGVNGGRQSPYSSEGFRCTPVVRGETTSFTCKLVGADVSTVVQLKFAVVFRGDQPSG